MKKGYSFKKLKVYDRSIGFVKMVYKTTKAFPRAEDFGLTSQLCRAAVSIPLNIAEGSAGTKKEFIRFLGIARGSIFECLAILDVAMDQEYISAEQKEKLEIELENISKMISGLKNALKTNN